jgi:hypothetical protein
MSYAETCSVCLNQTRWWRSKTGYQVCAVCSVTPFEALEILARRGPPGLIKTVQGWWKGQDFFSTPG